MYGKNVHLLNIKCNEFKSFLSVVYGLDWFGLFNNQFCPYSLFNCKIWLIYIVSILIITLYISNRAIGLISRVCPNGPGDRGSIPGWLIPETQKMVFDAALVSTQHYKVMTKGKVEQYWEWSSYLPYSSV